MQEIEKNIPIPPARAFMKTNAGGDKYGLMELEIGDSRLYLHGTGKRDHYDLRDRLVSSMYQRSKKHGRKFTYRAMDGGFRVWRIA